MNFGDWWNPERLYANGYPLGLSSALQLWPELRTDIRGVLDELHPQTVLEVGPGNAPVAIGLPGVVYLDRARHFLERLSGPRVQADLFHAPFAPKTFDLVIACDVLVHVPPERKVAAVHALADLGRSLLLFFTLDGTGEVPGSGTKPDTIASAMTAKGLHVEAWRIVAGTYEMALLKGTPRPNG